MSEWTPASWRASKVLLHQPPYEDPRAVQAVLAEIATLPPLVTSFEIEALKAQLAQAARGEKFLLQGGDCAEQFALCNSREITNKLKILLQMSLILAHGLKKGVIRVGRIAGQYAKPRTTATETKDGVTLPSYFGDNVNLAAFTAADRTPDPQRLIRGYERAAMTINFVRSLIQGGFADLQHPEYWDLDFMNSSPLAAEYKQIVRDVHDAMRFLEIFTDDRTSLHSVDFYTSHEALHLPYEEAQTRPVPRRDGHYNLSTHFPWVGMRTAVPDSAHIEYLRGIRNPVAIKVGAAMTSGWLTELLQAIDPAGEPGRVTLIHRFGAKQIAKYLPPLLRAVQSTGRRVLWVADPMHGNTTTASSGYKTRDFGDVVSELEQAFELHAANGSVLGGVHLELTGENVTECVGGARNYTANDLGRAYQTQVDPRLNYEQSLEIAMLISRKARAVRG